MNQSAAVDEGNDLHSRGQDVIVHFLDFFVESFQSGIGGGAFAQQHDAGDDVVVVDDLAVFADGTMGAVGA